MTFLPNLSSEKELTHVPPHVCVALIFIVYLYFRIVYIYMFFCFSEDENATLLSYGIENQSKLFIWDGMQVRKWSIQHYLMVF